MKILKVKSSQGCLGKNIGCEKAPDEICKILKEDFDLNFDFQEVNIKDNIEELNKKIYEAIKKENFILIGGDHSVSYPAFRAFSEKNKKDVGLLIFDAHLDCYHDFRPPSHEDFLKVLINDGLVNKEKVILVGVRRWWKEEQDFINENKIKVFTMSQLFGNLEESCDVIMETVRKFGNLYLSIDLDVVDPAFAPGSGYLEPGGMSSMELLYFLERLKLLKNLKMVDLVEINPDLDTNNISVKLGARIVNEFLN